MIEFIIHFKRFLKIKDDIQQNKNEGIWDEQAEHTLLNKDLTPFLQHNCENYYDYFNHAQGEKLPLIKIVQKEVYWSTKQSSDKVIHGQEAVPWETAVEAIYKIPSFFR